ncbi:ABC transporter ATP-binding protein/permease, partial [bacterium]|nr:ABC transporter ATP-binding protein/permease [bacterium]
ERSQLRADVPVGEQLSELRHNVLSDYSQALHHEQTFADAGRNIKNDLLDLLRENPASRVLGWICVIAIFLIFIKTASGYLQKIVFIRVEEKTVMMLRNDLFEHIESHSLPFFSRFGTGELVSRMVNDVSALKQFTVSNVAELLRNAALTLVFLGLAFFISWRLTLAVFVIVPPAVWVIARIGDKLKTYSGRAQAKTADIVHFLHEVFPAQRLVIAFRAVEHELDRFRHESYRYFRIYLKFMRLDSLAAPLSEFLTTAIGILVLWYGGSLVIQGSGGITASKFVVFCGALISMMRPVSVCARMYNEIQKGRAVLSRLWEVMDAPAEIVEARDAHPLENFSQSIRYEDVSFSYLPNEPVLRDCSVEIPHGSIIALVGTSGGGKSTLADLLVRYYDPTQGRITIDGHDLRDISLHSLRGLMGIVTQEILLFNISIRDNICYGKLDATDEEIEEAARIANAHAFIQALPSGYETRVGERGTRLSGGERQRIAIARAVLCNPQILILDEATSSLDSESEALIQEAISRLLRNRTTLVIAHRLSTIKQADRIYVVDKGRIIESGQHEQLLSQNGTYRRLYDLQFSEGHAQLQKE